MFRRYTYLMLCALLLTGCGKVDLSNEKQTSSSEVQIDSGSEEIDLTQEDVTQAVSEETNDLHENTTSLENQTNDDSQIKQETQESEKETVAKKYNLPEGFVYVDDVIPSAELEIRYYTDYNFVGEKIDGYIAPLAILTSEAANALKAAANRLAEDGYHIKIYDAYRPQKAVDCFVRWAQTDDASTKETFYPAMEKSILFQDGYISKKSRHSRGSTIDLTILDENDNEIDMGGYFDLLDTISNYDTNQITESQHNNRQYLRNIMDEAGFDSIRTEWWHFQLRNEPYPDTYFDFDIE
ncbi:M15 family metallopeptidase [Lachnotalea glycerini]|nr:M15 family metallopeptidase [Lachnotalea glycerini]